MTNESVNHLIETHQADDLRGAGLHARDTFHHRVQRLPIGQSRGDDDHVDGGARHVYAGGGDRRKRGARPAGESGAGRSVWRGFVLPGRGGWRLPLRAVSRTLRKMTNA